MARTAETPDPRDLSRKTKGLASHAGHDVLEAGAPITERPRLVC
jgi:hypothetical protein